MSFIEENCALEENEFWRQRASEGVLSEFHLEFLCISAISEEIPSKQKKNAPVAWPIFVIGISIAYSSAWDFGKKNKQLLINCPASIW